MGLRGQRGRRGYAMAALLVMLGVMSVLMTAALPAWRFQAKREKELELIFRGEQYMRAIGLWERKMGPGSRPPNIDTLVQQRFLRKKYKDPMTPDGEFQPLLVGVNPNPGAGSTPGQATGPGQPRPQGPPSTGAGRGFPGGQQSGSGGLMGVVSKSKEASIIVYRGRGTHYNEWLFIYAGLANQPGAGGRGVPGGQARPGAPVGPGGRGINNPGMPPGGRGMPFPGRGRGGIIRGPGQ